MSEAAGGGIVAEGQTRQARPSSRRPVWMLSPLGEVGIRLAVAAAWFGSHEFTSNVRHLWLRFHPLAIDHLPYRDFRWEYPPLSALPVLPARLLGLRPFQVTFVVLMVATEYAALRTLRRAFPARAAQITAYWTAVVVVALPISWFVVDPVSVLFACLAIVAFRARRGHAFTVATTLGVATKLWPGVLVVAPAVARRWRLVGSTLLASAGLLLVWWAFAPSGFDEFRRYREGSGFEIESLPAVFGLFSRATVHSVSGSDVVYAGQFRWVGLGLVALWIVLVFGCVVVALRRSVDALPLLTGLIVALLVLSRIFSFQYLLWAVPFFSMLWARRERFLPAIYAGCCLITLVVFSLWWSVLINEQSGTVRTWAALALTLRNLVLAYVAVALIAQSFRCAGRANSEVTL